ncbi:pleckstrin homology domain-containing family F member 1 [Triplophysa rosa]|uniref:Pleckstrin homology domain-containing family F member 1 n=1 Tax=Triplophysa rosa TaxID=992332 RepID=A0A9W7X6J3_TRIRA|nr:pleckstrin homology domain-containing family F member 1 [Triplophysa rosa]KAI7814851.1 pleckstrin homology domain-containing family F member 1 [Triplophysa rosa]
MAEQLTFFNKNRERIQAVENTFGHTGKSLLRPERVLVGEGRLLKLCRRGPKPKVFFLFNDILVYGSIMVPGRWNNKKQTIPLDEVEVEDMQDETTMANQFLIRTPRKSFYVAAASPDEKQAWMEHIEQYKALLLQHKGRPTDSTARSFAATWIPDTASAICMRCSDRFTVANRRHHCRMCGYIVCGACSKDRALLLNISSSPVRVCRHCVVHLQAQDHREIRYKKQRRVKGKNWKKSSVEDSPTQPEYESSSEEEEDRGYQVPSKWFSGVQQENHSKYCYLKPEHRTPPLRAL